jgi:hypothetical protein
MPSRIVREGFNDSRAINALSEECEVFYHRLMLIVDDYGRFEADPELIRARCFPRQLDRWPLTRVRQCLTTVGQVPVENNGLPLVLIYRSGDKEYLEISNFCQRTRGKSKYPEPTARDTVSALRALPDNDGQCPPNAYAYAESNAKSDQPSAVSLPGRWRADTVFVKFQVDYLAMGAAMIDDDFARAFEFAWKKLDYEQKLARVKSLEQHQEEYSSDPRYIPKPLKFIQTEWERPPKPKSPGVGRPAVSLYKRVDDNGVEISG